MAKAPPKTPRAQPSAPIPTGINTQSGKIDVTDVLVHQLGEMGIDPSDPAKLTEAFQAIVVTNSFNSNSALILPQTVRELANLPPDDRARFLAIFEKSHEHAHSIQLTRAEHERQLSAERQTFDLEYRRIEQEMAREAQAAFLAQNSLQKRDESDSFKRGQYFGGAAACLAVIASATIVIVVPTVWGAITACIVAVAVVGGSGAAHTLATRLGFNIGTGKGSDISSPHPSNPRDTH